MAQMNIQLCVLKRHLTEEERQTEIKGEKKNGKQHNTHEREPIDANAPWHGRRRCAAECFACKTVNSEYGPHARRTCICRHPRTPYRMPSPSSPSSQSRSDATTASPHKDKMNSQSLSAGVQERRPNAPADEFNESYGR